MKSLRNRAKISQRTMNGWDITFYPVIQVTYLSQQTKIRHSTQDSNLVREDAAVVAHLVLVGDPWIQADTEQRYS